MSRREGLGLLEMLGLRGFDRRRGTKLVRHKTSSYDVHELLQKGRLEAYQAFQSRPVFDG